MQAVSVYRLDCTDLADWPVLSDQAVELALAVLGRRPRTEFTLKPMATADENADTRPVYGEYYCNDCDRVFSSESTIRTPTIKIDCFVVAIRDVLPASPVLGFTGGGRPILCVVED